MDWIINLLFFLLWLAIATAAWAGWSAAPWVPSKTRYRKLFLDRIPIEPEDVIYDLGCGTGTVLMDVLERYPNTRAIGVEVSLIPYCIAKIRSWSRSSMKVAFGDLFRHDIQDADIVFVYLLEKAYPKLIKKLRAELKPNAIVVLEAWPFKDIDPWKVIRVDQTLPIYLYRGQDLR